jgi:hypothetical protein
MKKYVPSLGAGGERVSAPVICWRKLLKIERYKRAECSRSKKKKES